MDDGQIPSEAELGVVVADITYVATWSGFVYVALISDLFSRRIVGWRTAPHLHADLAIDALNHACWQRARECADVAGLIHHADRGVCLTPDDG